MISKDEWRTIAQRAAAAKYGERRARYYAWRRWYAMPTGVAAGLALIGLGCWWVKVHAVDPVLHGSGPHVPVGLIVFAALVIGLTVVVFRRRIVPQSPTVMLGTRAVAVLAWFALTGYALAVVI